MKQWFPTHPPIYDIGKTYLENATDGPFFHGPIPQRPSPKKTIEFFGHTVNSPIGVPAGPLLNSRWVALAAKLGFDIPTYKTIRSFAHPGHALPNMIYVEPIDSKHAKQAPTPTSLSHLTVTNSFGMPSRSPDYLLEDIAKANASLSKGQVMIVSIVGTPNQGMSFLEDFVRTAQLAKSAGAKIIEANFSCPNVDRAEGCLYMNPETVQQYAHAISRAIHPIPLILKIGLIEHTEQLRHTLNAAATGGASGICAVNSVSMEVTDAHGHAPLGKDRKTSGVCGAAIRAPALRMIQNAASLIHSERLDLTLLGCGGIVAPEHFAEFLHAGAHIAMSATGMMWDPYLALRYHETL
jgi:dihydroorotate dehydrogenase